MLLDKNGHVRLTDFGVAKETRPRDDTKRPLSRSETYSFCGTPEYMAPEILSGRGHGWVADTRDLEIALLTHQ